MANSVSNDTIVIGGGIAGLSAAAHLAKAGKKVVLFEQHDKPGGYYTSFVRDGIIFDITAHWTVAHERVPFVDGLYLAGHWVGPSGIFNVAQSGKNAAELILG